MLSVVIPTQNEAAVIGARLDEIESSLIVGEIIVTDGGSADGTQAIVERHTREDDTASQRRGGQRAAWSH